MTPMPFIVQPGCKGDILVDTDSSDSDEELSEHNTAMLEGNDDFGDS